MTAMVATLKRNEGTLRPAQQTDSLADLLGALANIGMSRTALAMTSKVMKAVSAATDRLPPQQQELIIADQDLPGAIEALISASAIRMSGDLVHVAIEGPVEESEGEGLGEPLSIAEGHRRLIGYGEPQRLEDWAGAVAGPIELEEKLGIKRSTLHSWQKRGAVIGLLKGAKKHVFPLAQFVDGRPVEGMSELTQIIRNHRAAWRWLIQDKPSIGGVPLALLKQGQASQVLQAAIQDFG